MNSPIKKYVIDFQILFENSSEGLLIVDLSKNLIVLANPASLKLLDKTADEILQQSIIATFPELKNAADFLENSREILHSQKDETTVWLKTNAYLLPQSDGQLMVISMQDITEMMAQKKQIEQHEKELDTYIKSNQHLENFAFAAAHDLQSPINTMASFSKFLKASLEEEDLEEAMEYADFINQAAHNLKALVKDLLAFSRAKSTQYNPETFNLKRMAESLTKELDFSIKKQKATVSFDNLPEEFVGDKVKIRQLLQNLISNGIKFKNPKIPPSVLVSCQEDKAAWKFSVKDNGIGIEKKNFEEIFQLFRRLNHKKAFSGTGIGLALCQNIVNQHKGRIWLESEMGQGTIFYFTIPKFD